MTAARCRHFGGHLFVRYAFFMQVSVDLYVQLHNKCLCVVYAIKQFIAVYVYVYVWGLTF